MVYDVYWGYSRVYADRLAGLVFADGPGRQRGKGGFGGPERTGRKVLVEAVLWYSGGNECVRACEHCQGANMDLGAIVGLIGGILGIATWIENRWQKWKERGRLDICLLRLSYYVDKFGDSSGLAFPLGYPPGTSGYKLPEGMIKHAFTILEFEITNCYRNPVTIGRIQIDDWIFSECYHQHMYDQPQDYRAFDLYRRDSVSLAPITHWSLGRRSAVELR
jgi:hypothetical protein